LAQRIEILDWHHKNGQNQSKTAWHFNLIYPNLKIEQPLVLSWTKEEAKWCELWEQTDHQSVAWTKFAKAESYWIAWTESIPLPTHAQIIFALTKHVWYFVMQLQVADGISGRIQVALSLIHIITSIIAPLITCAENIAIQAH
jgi:hypothetical protein